MDESDVVFATGHDAQGWTILDFETRGYTGLNLERIVFDAVLPSGSRIEVLADSNRNGLRDRTDRVIDTLPEPGTGTIALSTPLALLAGVDASESLIQPAPLHYRLFIKASARDVTTPMPLKNIRPVLTNRITHQPVSPTPAPLGNAVSHTTSGHPWDAPVPESKEFRLSGMVELASTLVVAAGDRLIVEPGTVVRLGPDVSILARGQIVASQSSFHCGSISASC